MAFRACSVVSRRVVGSYGRRAFSSSPIANVCNVEQYELHEHISKIHEF